MNANVPNLDACDSDELMGFWQFYQGGRGNRYLFPDGGKGTRVATASLANYASNKATAIQSRKRGDIQSALMYEAIADRIYSGLPTWARW